MSKFNAATAFSAFAKMFQAAAKADPGGLEDALDQWQDHGAGQHKSPAARALRLGSPQEASGAGADQMAEDFSDVRPQTGINAQYVQFAKMLAEMSRDATVSQNREDESYASAAKARLRKARSALLRADLADEPAMIADRAAHLQKASAALANARRLLAKAAEEIEETGGRDADDDDDAEEIGKATKELSRLTALLKAATGGVVDAPAAKAAGLPSITPAQLADAIMGRSVNPGAPDMSPFRKSGPSADHATNVSTRIEQALEAGTITEDDALAAETMLQRMNLASAGQIPMQSVTDALVKSNGNVQALFGVGHVPGHLTIGAGH